MTVLLLDNYDSFTWNLYQMVQAQTDWPVRVVRNDECTLDDIRRLAPARIILSPGPGHPVNPQDFGVCRDVILNHDSLNCPILGVCLGQQGMIHHFGGQVVPAPTIMHGKTSPVRIIKASPLLEGLPDPFTVMRYHSWVVSHKDFPADFDIIAETATSGADASTSQAAEPLIMAVQHKTRPLFGVQFHPESIGTPQGGQLLKNFLNYAPVPT